MNDLQNIIYTLFALLTVSLLFTYPPLTDFHLLIQFAICILKFTLSY